MKYLLPMTTGIDNFYEITAFDFDLNRNKTYTY